MEILRPARPLQMLVITSRKLVANLSENPPKMGMSQVIGYPNLFSILVGLKS